MKNYLKYIYFVIAVAAITACSDKWPENLTGSNYDITFNEIPMERFSFKIPDGAFQSGDTKSGIITLNSVKKGNSDIEGGFVLSNKNWRSFPWSLSEDFSASSASDAVKSAAMDSCRFSVFTTNGNTNQTYVVAKVKDDLAYFTLNTPDIIESILVANTTYNYLLMSYGSYYSSFLNTETQWYESIDAKGEPALISNPKIPETTAKGRFSLVTPDGNPIMRLEGVSTLVKDKASKESADKNRAEGASADKIYNDSIDARNTTGAGWFKLIIKGYLNGAQVGTVEYYMGARTNAVKDYPKLNTIKDQWYAVNLTELGKVDKIVFNLDSSDKDVNGIMRTPPYFCLDGIRLKNRYKEK